MKTSSRRGTRRMVRAFSISACLAIALSGCGLLSGCGTGDQLVPVDGTVTLDGKPLAGATIVLHPTTAAGPGPFSGATDSAGHFSLSPSANADRSGAVSGTYRLAISTLKLAPTDGDDDAAVPQVLAKEQVPEAYRIGNMRFEVPTEGTREANFDLRSRR